MVCTSLAKALELPPNDTTVKKIAEALREPRVLELCIPSCTRTFGPATYHSQSQILETLDWRQLDAYTLYWQMWYVPFAS